MYSPSRERTFPLRSRPIQWTIPSSGRPPTFSGATSPWPIPEISGRKGDSTREFAKAAKEASVLIIQGTRAWRADPQDGEKTVVRLRRWLRRLNIAPAGFLAAKVGGSPPAFEGEHHASGARVPGRPGLGHRSSAPGRSTIKELLSVIQ